MIILVVAAAGVFSACSKDDNGLVSLNVEISDYTDGTNAKMYVDASRYTHWTSGDQVMINSSSCPVSLSGAKAQITSVPESNFGYSAVYPASIATAYFGATTTSFNVTLPTVQTYAEDGNGNQIIAAPMFARCNKGENTLSFQNLCSLLKVTVNNDRDEDIDMQSIKVTSTNGNLSGMANISNVTTTPIFVMGTGASSYNYVTLNFTSETISRGSSKSYYMVVPAFNESDITIDVVATSNGTLETGKTTSNATLNANSIVQGPVFSLSSVAYIGTEENPYKINNLDDLIAFRTRVNGGTTYEGFFIKLMDDIDCGSTWTPIGTMSNNFKGTFDGNNKTITYAIPSTSSSYIGLFGYTQNATIKDLNVDATIVQTSGGSVGGIVARQEGGSVIGCTATGTITTAGNYVGGIVGRNYGSVQNTILSCTSSVNITSTKTNMNYVGGILGYFYTAGTVTNCSASGSVYAPEATGTYVGGIVGNSTGASTITYNSFTGNVRGSGNVGMIAGSKASATTIANCTYSATNAGSTYKGVGASGTQTGNDTGCTAE